MKLIWISFAALHGKLGLGHTVTIDSEAGFNVETLPYKTFTFVAWDAGEPNEIQSLRQQYYPGDI